eukprot:g4274.t1
MRQAAAPYGLASPRGHSKAKARPLGSKTCASPRLGESMPSPIATLVRPFDDAGLVDEDDPALSSASPASSETMGSSVAGTSPRTSPMSSSGALSGLSGTGSMLMASLSSGSDVSDRTPTHMDRRSSIRDGVSLQDYDSGEEKTYFEGKDNDDDELSDSAPSLEESPVQVGMHDKLREMGFRETIVRAATDHCDDLSVAVQYAADYNHIHGSSASHQSASSSRPMTLHPTMSPSNAPRSDWASSKISSSSMLQSATEYSASFTKRQCQNSASNSSSSTSIASTPSRGASSKCSDNESKNETRREILQRHLLQLGFEHSAVKSAVRRCSSTPAAARFIMDGGVAGWERKTASAVFECGICMCDDVGEEDMITLSCNHRFCKQCMLVFVGSLIESHKVLDDEDFVCPETGCNAPLDLPIVKELVSAQTFERLLELKLRKEYAENREEVRTCPKCEVMVVIEDIEQNSELLDSLTCINKNCRHKFCGRCGLDPHKGVSCEDYAAFVQANDKSAQIFEEYLRDNNMKRCPKCLLPAELKSGCHFIRCVCKTCYCYLCGRELFEHSHYSHYHKGPYSKKCYGGAKDKKGYVALPACAGCKGPTCKKCADSCEEEKRKRLEKIAQRDAAKMNGKQKGNRLTSWMARIRGMRRQRRRQRK